MKGNRGQTAITILFGLIMFSILYFMFFAGFISEWCQLTITQNNLSGLEAFLLGNMNLWIIVVVLIFIFASLYWGGER